MANGRPSPVVRGKGGRNSVIRAREVFVPVVAVFVVAAALVVGVRYYAARGPDVDAGQRQPSPRRSEEEPH